MALTVAQLAVFRRDGLLAVPNVFSDGQIKSWRRQFDEHTAFLQREHQLHEHVKGNHGAGEPLHGCPIRSSATWPTHPTDFPYFFLHPHPDETPVLRQIIDQLGGPGRLSYGEPVQGKAWYGDVRGVFPEPEGTAWVPPGDAGGHIDGYGGANSWGGGFQLGATFYLNEVRPQGGGLFVWPRSHAAVHDYFRKNEGSIDGRYICDPRYPEGAWRALCGESLTRDPQEFVGKPGTLLLWHAWTVHSPSLNCRPKEPRIAVHLRYYDEQMRGGLVRHGMSGLPGDPGPGTLDPAAPGPHQQAQQLRYLIGVAEDPWQYWGVAVASVHTAAPALVQAEARL